MYIELKGISGKSYTLDNDFLGTLITKTDKQTTPKLKAKQITKIEINQSKAAVKQENNNQTKTTDSEAKLEKIKKLYEKGLITKEEYDQERKEVLDAM